MTNAPDAGNEKEQLTEAGAGQRRPLIVFGLGNLLMGDDGVGVRVVELAALRWAGRFGDSALRSAVEFVDGGVGGLRLLNALERATEAIFVDAADMGLPAGRYRWIDATNLKTSVGQQWSLHSMGLASLLEMAALMGTAPAVTVLAVQPAEVVPRDRLSPALEQALPEIAEALLQRVLEIVGPPEASGQR